NQARFSLDEAIEVLLWVQSVTQMPYSSDPSTCRTAADVADLLKDGVHLCNELLIRVSEQAHLESTQRSPAQARGADVEFPPWVVRLSHSRPRQFPESVMRRGEMVIPLQYGTNKCASQKGMTPYGLARQIKPDPSG
ncbi:calponin family repeat-containing domain protein, partial [Teladorsagia circumcincta]